MSEIGVVVPAFDSSRLTIRGKLVAILQIDGQEEMEKWGGGSANFVYLLPGVHSFRVERRQGTLPTFSIIDLITGVQDMFADLAHAKTNIAFPVKAGLIHRIQYDDSKRVFYVSLDGPATEKVPSVPLQPADDAVPCVKNPDRTKELWCELRQ